MKIHFNFTPKSGCNSRDIISELLEDETFYKYLSTMQDKELRMELRLIVKKDSKQALYDYYHGPLMSVAISAYTNAGYELMDSVKVDYMLKAECAKGTMTTPDGERFYLLDKAKMPKDRLIKFVNDVITHLVMNLDVPIENIPDAQSYKELQKTGYAFKSVKSKK